jgi:hypothetical protein
MSLNESMKTVTLANAFGKQIRPFASVDRVSMSALRWINGWLIGRNHGIPCGLVTG